MRIHGFFYLVVGTSVAVFAKIVGSPKLLLFVFVGILLGLYGIARMIIDAMKDKPEKERGHPGPFPQNHYVTTHQRVTRDVAAYYCPNCGSPLSHTDNFCAKCGRRLR